MDRALVTPPAVEPLSLAEAKGHLRVVLDLEDTELAAYITAARQYGNFGFEPPQQACWLMTPEHGKTWTAPILCQDRKAEGW